MSKHVKAVIKYLEKHWLYVVLFAMLFTYTVSMLLGLGQSVWFDESYSIILAKRPLHELLSLTAVDAHPPLYYLYLKVWGSVFGWSEFALRSSTALIGAAGIGMAAILVRQMFSSRVALVVLPFTVFAPFLLRYDFEIRMYAIASLIGLAATWVLLRARTSSDRRWWALYAVLVALGMYTLYMTIAIWITHVVWLIVMKYRETKSVVAVMKQPAVAAYAGAVALFLPYIPTFLAQTNLSALPPGVGSVVTREKFVGIAAQLLGYTPDWLVQTWQWCVYAIVVALAGYIFVKVWRHARQAQKDLLLLILLLVFVPVIFYTIITYALAPLFMYRYMAHVAIYSYVLIGLIAALGWKLVPRATQIYVVLVGALVASGLIQLNQMGNYNLERTQRPMGAQVRQAIDCSDDETVIVADDLYAYIDLRYYFDDCDLRFNNFEDPVYTGGFAPLHGSDKRVGSSDDLQHETLVHVYQSDLPKTFHPASPYVKVDSQTFGLNVVDTYRRK